MKEKKYAYIDWEKLFFKQKSQIYFLKKSLWKKKD